MDFEGGDGSVSDGVHIILTLVLDLDFGGKMVLVGFWSWGTIVNARDEGSLIFLAFVVLTFFNPEASSSRYFLHFSGVFSYSLSSSPSASTSLTTLVCFFCLIFRRLVSMDSNYVAKG